MPLNVPVAQVSYRCHIPVGLLAPISTAGTAYTGLGIHVTDLTTDVMQMPVNGGGSLLGLALRNKNALAADQTLTVTVMLDGVATALSVTWGNSSAALTLKQVAAVVPFSDGQRLSLRYVKTGAGSADAVKPCHGTLLVEASV